jgi:uncharacterized membrane protein (Fun14 family)
LALGLIFFGAAVAVAVAVVVVVGMIVVIIIGVSVLETMFVRAINWALWSALIDRPLASKIDAKS